MSIRKAIVTGVALFAAVSVCHASKLALTSSDSDKEEETKAQGTSGENADAESLDLRALKSGDILTFSISDDDFPESIDGYEVLTSFLPEEVELEWTGKKLKAPKSGKIKYSKKEEDFVDTKDSDNPSGLSVKFNKKKGTVSGSFKVYVAKSEKKLKSYSAKFSGKAGEEMNVTLKKKVIAVAVIQAEDAEQTDDAAQATAAQTATAK